MVGGWRDVIPSVTSPGDWTMDLALDYVRYIAQKCVGDHIVSGRRMARQGEPLSPGSKVSLLGAVRTFFHDLQDWEWIKRRFNPNRGFVVPKQVMRALEFKPRPIDDGFWLKLRTASLALGPGDLPEPKRVKSYLYPFELAQAVAVAWTFSGCRLNEIVRLEVGCTYVEHLPEQADPASGEIVAAFDQPMLRVPVNKTRGEFVKPIEEPMARAIAAWERVRPPQRQALDRNDRTVHRSSILLSWPANRQRIRQCRGNPDLVEEGRATTGGYAWSDHQSPRAGNPGNQTL